jgi:hypothetical protein
MVAPVWTEEAAGHLPATLVLKIPAMVNEKKCDIFSDVAPRRAPP